jgi:hypothetical protein
VKSYEIFGAPLSGAAENVVFLMLDAITKLNKRIIKDPNSINRWKKIYNKEIENIVRQFDLEWKNWANKDLAQAYIAGIKSANSQMKKLGIDSSIKKEIADGSFLVKRPPAMLPIPEISGQVIAWFEGFENQVNFFNVFRAAAYYNLDKQPLQILRIADDIYRKTSIMAGESLFRESDIYTRRKFSQKMLNSFAEKGIQTITYRNGSKWSIDNYCEMVGRTLAGRASMQANLNRYNESGYNLVIVSSHFRACNLCTPYENKILSIEPTAKYESVSDAETQGLFHPNCKHSVSAFFEGISEITPPRLATGEQDLVDQYGYKEAQKISYKAQVKQRYIERNIRNWKRKEIVSLNDNEKIRAKNKIREWQEKQRNHLDENIFLKRKYNREQIKTAH